MQFGFKAKLVYLLAAVLLLLAVVQPAYGYTWQYAQQYPLAQDDVTYYDVAAQNSLGVQKAHYIKYRPGGDVTPVVAYGRGFYGRSSIGYVAEYLRTDLDYSVLAGINADYFNTDTGVPIGMVIVDGRLISSAGGAYAVGFREDGSYIFGKPVLDIKLTSDNAEVKVENLNKTRSSYTVNLYDHNWGTETRISSLGTNVLLEKLDDDEISIGCNIRLRVVDVTETAMSTPLADDQMLLTVAATGDATKVAVFREGDVVELTVTAGDEAWDEAVYAVGGKSLLLDGQPAVTGIPTGKAARSAVGFMADGSMIFYENDGRQTGYSVGLSPEVLAEEMQAMGVVNALSLDGGGSSVMSVKRGGEALSVVNSPSDGKPRLCANYIFLVQQDPEEGDKELLHIKPDGRYLLAGADMNLTAVLLDNTLAPVEITSEVDWWVDDDLGEIETLDWDDIAAEVIAENAEDDESTEVIEAVGKEAAVSVIAADDEENDDDEDEEDEEIVNEYGYAVFHAGDKTGKVTVEAEYKRISVEQNIYIISAVDSLRIQRNGSTLTSISTLPGEAVELTALGLYQGEQVAMSANNVEWTVVGDIGSIKAAADGSAVFRVGGNDESGRIVARVGEVEASVTVQNQTDDSTAIVAVNLPKELAVGEYVNFGWRVTAGYGTYFPAYEQITVLLDGKAQEFIYDKSTGVVELACSDLTEGQHRLTVVVEDDNGMLARKSITVTVGEGAAELQYADVPAEHWAADYIAYLSSVGLMQGEQNAAGELTFNPNRNLTRAEFAVVAARYLGLDTSQAIPLPYADRPELPGWALGAIRAVYAEGIMMGQDVKGESYFYPRSNISRQEAMAVISRILTDKYPAEEQSFADADQISAWAKQDVDRLVTLGFVGGYEDDTIRPLNGITRAEIAKILFNLY